MTRRDAKIVARRLRRHPDVSSATPIWDGRRWVIWLDVCVGGMWVNDWLGLTPMPRGHAAVLAWLGLSPGVPERPDMSPAHAADDAAD